MLPPPVDHKAINPLDEYFSQDALISTNTFLKVTIIVGLFVLMMATFVGLGQFMEPLAPFSRSFAIMATPLRSTVIIATGFVLSFVMGLYLFLRQKQAEEELRTALTSLATPPISEGVGTI